MSIKNNQLFLLAGSTVVVAGAFAVSVSALAAPTPEVKEAITNKDFSAYQLATQDRDCNNVVKTEEDFAKVIQIDEKMTASREARQNGDRVKATELRTEADKLREELGMPTRQGQGNGDGQRKGQGSQDGTGIPKGGSYGRNVE
jgi:hypothetical protein